MGRLIALLTALLVAAAIAWTVQQTPRPAPASAPAAAFAAERAMIDLRVVARIPHPIGSDANHAVRDYLVRRLQELGLSPQVRRGASVYQSRWRKGLLAGGEVENIVGALPGRDRAAPALALMAHYDSVPGSPGGSDDAAGVVAALETVRALAARGVPARDVMVVLTDGEESGLLGARAFFARDPLARRIGFVLNMEARGSAGRVQMFQAGAPDGGSIALLRRNAARPQAASLSEFVYDHMPNDTDFSVPRALGVGGLNFAFTGRQFDYHAATSTAAAQDPGTLQDLGDQVLAAAAEAAFAPALPPTSPDVAYSQLFDDLILAYPPAAGWGLLAASAALIALAFLRARRLAPMAWTDVLRGLGAALFAVVGAMAILHFARRATGAGFGYLEQRFLLAQAGRWEWAVMLLGLGFLLAAIAEIGRGRRQIAFLPLAAGLGSSVFGALDMTGLVLGIAAALLAVAAYGRPVGRPGAWAGCLALGLIAATAAQILAAPTAFVVQWPLLLAAGAAAATDLSARKGVGALVILGVAAALGVGWLGGYGHAAFVSLDLVELVGVALFSAALLLWPLAQPAEGAPPERLVGPALLIVGLALTAAVRFNNPYDARHPQASYVVYQLDQAAGRAWRVSATPERPAWAEAALTADGGRITSLSSWLWAHPVDAAPAPVRPLPAPTLSLARQADGALRLHAVAPPGARTLTLRLAADTPVVVVAVQGMPVRAPVDPRASMRLLWDAPPAAGVDLTLRPAGPGKLEVGYNVKLEDWPAGLAPLPPRPPNVMPFEWSDAAFIVGARRFAW